MSAIVSTESDPGAARDALTHVLALESRNALARVELAASELARFDTNPSMREMLETIRDAAGDLDALLGKIALLWSPRAGARGRVIELDAVLAQVLERLTPTLDALGIELDVTPGVGVCRLGLSTPALERLLFGFLRLARATLGAGQRLGLATRREADGVAVVLSVCAPATATRTAFRLDPELRLELDLQLAELFGRLAVSGEGTGELTLWLPAEREDA